MIRFTRLRISKTHFSQVEETYSMGAPISADDHTFEVIREYSHQARRKRTDVLRELAKPLEERLEHEFGVRIVEGQVVRAESSSRKAKVAK